MDSQAIDMGLAFAAGPENWESTRRSLTEAGGWIAGDQTRERRVAEPENRSP
jgi:hypothetical protein